MAKKPEFDIKFTIETKEDFICAAEMMVPFMEKLEDAIYEHIAPHIGRGRGKTSIENISYDEFGTVTIQYEDVWWGGSERYFFPIDWYFDGNMKEKAMERQAEELEAQRLRRESEKAAEDERKIKEAMGVLTKHGYSVDTDK